MKTLAFLTGLLLALGFGLTGCKKPDKTGGTLTIEIKGKFGDQYFALDTFNTDDAGRIIMVNKLKFYLSHIALVKDDNTSVELSPVELVEFDRPSSQTLTYTNVYGDFSKLTFGCGVDATQNQIDPAAAPAGSPLSADITDMYWDMLKYRFEVLEGGWDTVATLNQHHGFGYHVGLDVNYRQTTLTKSISVCCNNNVKVTLYIDVAKIFNGPPAIDLNTETATQSTDHADLAAKFATNFSNAFEF